MTKLKWWMKVVGAFYLLLSFLIIFLRVPITAEGPKGALAQAAAGDPLANFLVDTWVTYGLDFFVIGTVLLISSRKPDQAKPLIWVVLGLELIRGI